MSSLSPSIQETLLKSIITFLIYFGAALVLLNRLFGINLVMSAGHIGGPFDGIEDEKLGLGAEEGRVADAR